MSYKDKSELCLETRSNALKKFNFPETTKEFIASKFITRTCYKFKIAKGDKCVCNKTQSDHKEFANSNEPWSYNINTSLSPCNTFGFINFVDYDYVPRGHYPKFITFDCLENCELTCENVYKLLTEQEPWKIPTPKLIISINGGLKRMKFISKQHKKNFKQGLIGVIKKDQTWIFGSGFNVGIHKLVTETITDFRLYQEEMQDQVSLIGISSFGCILNNDRLRSRQTYKSNASTRHHLFKYEHSLLNEKSKVLLDAFYDNFLFCDDGSEKKYDVETDFRLKFENYVKKKADGFLVQIVYEGGKRAIKNAYNALSDKVPLVIMKGTGRAANIISEVMELPIKNYKDNIYNIVKENVDLLDLSENNQDNNEIDEYTNYLLKMYTDFKKLMVIYDMMDTNIRFDKKILEAMIIGADKSLAKTLELCIRFNCPNIADKFVFSNPNYFNVKHQSITEMFLSTLKDNKPQFVDLFMENNFDADKFISEEILRDLYQVSFDPDKCQCAELLSDLTSNTRTSCFVKRNECNKDHDILLSIDVIIQKLTKHILNNRYKDLLSKKTKNDLIDEKDSDSDEEFSESEDESVRNRLNIQDLFLWALLSGRTDLSEIFWKSGKDLTGSALIASYILKNMASLVLIRGDNNLQQKLTEASKKYQDLAVSIITESYSKSKSKTYTLMIRELKRWNKLTCLQIAINGDMLDFLNHSACRSYTTKVWMGDLSPFLSCWKIILTIPFSLILMRLIIIPSFPQKNVDLDTEWEEGYPPIRYKMKTAKEESNKVNFKNKHLISEHNTFNPKKNKSMNISFIKAMSIFYRAPVVKFYINLFAYIAFLMIFSYLNLVELKPISQVKSTKQHIFAEIFVYVYVLTFIIEEIRQVIDQEIYGCHYKIMSYFVGTWNKFDAFIILCFIISIITRFTIADHHFMLCRCFFSITLSMFFLRSMQFYFVNKSIGPKVIMIRDMLRDILFFLSIFVIFVMAYGTLAHTLRHPNSIFDLNLIKDIIYMPYFQTYGELMLDNFEVSGPCNGTDCIIKGTVVIFGFGVFLLLTNILLINLLIAMFGYTFNQIQEDSEKLWCYIRIQLVQEFYAKPIFPPPLNIIYYIFRIISLPCTRRCPSIIFDQENNLLLKELNTDRSLMICMFEQQCMESFMLQLQNTDKSKTDNWNPEQTNTVELVEKQDVKYDTSAPNNPMESMASFQVRIDRRLDCIVNQIEKLKIKSNP